MPTYQYACTACDHRFDAVQAFSDASLTECPECSGKLRKLYGSVGVVFKGSGFYRTDSRSENKPAAAAATPSAATPSTSTPSSDKSSSSSSSTTSTTPSTTSSSTSSTAKVAS